MDITLIYWVCAILQAFVALRIFRVTTKDAPMLSLFLLIILAPMVTIFIVLLMLEKLLNMIVGNK